MQEQHARGKRETAHATRKAFNCCGSGTHPSRSSVAAVTDRLCRDCCRGTAGEPFAHSQQVGSYDPAFAGGIFRGSFRIPARMFEQLAERHKSWPIPWTEQDRETPWLAPERLMLYVQIAKPRDDMAVAMMIDGAAVPLKKAYSSVVPHQKCFVGWYVDVRPQLCEGSRYYSGVAAVRAGTVPGSVFRERGTRVHAVSYIDVSLYNPMAKEWRW